MELESMAANSEMMGGIWAPLYGQGRHTRRAQELNVWAEQERANHLRCFGTERRFTCEEIGCPWRTECMSLCAEWRR
jgi:hypothetical protein